MIMVRKLQTLDDLFVLFYDEETFMEDELIYLTNESLDE